MSPLKEGNPLLEEGLLRQEEGCLLLEEEPRRRRSLFRTYTCGWEIPYRHQWNNLPECRGSRSWRPSGKIRDTTDLPSSRIFRLQQIWTCSVFQSPLPFNISNSKPKESKPPLSIDQYCRYSYGNRIMNKKENSMKEKLKRENSVTHEKAWRWASTGYKSSFS